MTTYRGRGPVEPHVVVAEVVTTKLISPHMMRVTLGGEGLKQLTFVGDDQWFRLFLPRSGQDSLRLPTRTSSLGWYAQYLVTPRSRRPIVRNYTVRASRPELHELDVDFVLHGHGDENGSGHDGAAPSGPGSTFALTARPGDTVGLLDQGAYYRPGHDPGLESGWSLLVADESGLPAVAGICESLPDDARGTVVVEVPTSDDRQDFRVPAGVELLWVERDRAAADDAALGEVPGRAALATVLGLTVPAGPCYALVAGEQALAAGVRRHLVNDRGWPKTHIDFVGYWRHGKASPS